MKKPGTWWIALAVAGLAVWGTGCETVDDSERPAAREGQEGQAPAAPGPGENMDLPQNPSVPASTPGSNDQRWYFNYKSYDNTFRIRWPTYFFTVHRVGSGSYTLVNGERAEFRSYDTDNGAQRPSYTIPGPRSRFSGSVVCILVARNGEKLGWFVTTVGGATQGTLP